MHTKWQQHPCCNCSRPVYFLPAWPNRPLKCHYCQFLEIKDLPGLLERFLRHEEKLAKQFKPQVDRDLLNEREPLRRKIKYTLQRLSCSPQDLAEACAKDQEIRKVIYSMARDKRYDDKSSKSSGTTLPKRIGRLLQGGAPGLGKRK
jgi:hypothetical protein